jgi:hypothetical protein
MTFNEMMAWIAKELQRNGYDITNLDWGAYSKYDGWIDGTITKQGTEKQRG